MCIAFGRVQKEVTNAGPGNVLVLWCHIREPDARSNALTSPLLSCALQVTLSEVRETKQPQDCLRNFVQYPQPSSECSLDDLAS
jgi:hypothetical protein